MPNYPKSRQSNLVVQEMEAELLIYDLQTNKAFCLNQTSAMVWQFCDGKNSIAEIAEAMSRKLKMQVSEEFVWLALDSLKRDDLLEKADEFEINFGGLNRRELVKKVGLSSMIMLPIISSIIAPSSLMAQSSGNLPLLSVCTNNSQCASGICRSVVDAPSLQCCAANPASGGVFNPGFVDCVMSVQSCDNFANRCCSGVSRSSSVGCPGSLIQCRCL